MVAFEKGHYICEMYNENNQGLIFIKNAFEYVIRSLNLIKHAFKHILMGKSSII